MDNMVILKWGSSILRRTAPGDVVRALFSAAPRLVPAFWRLPGKRVDTSVDPAGRSACATSLPMQLGSKRLRPLSVLFLLALAGATVLWGQVVGASLSGTVKDESGSGVAAAVVSVRSLETGAERKLIADDA